MIKILENSLSYRFYKRDQFMKRLRNLLISAITISSIFIPSEISKAEEKIEVIP